MQQGNGGGYRLVVRRGPQPNQVYELTAEVMNLGRDITNDIVINDREVSRHHLRLMQGADGFTLEDLGSTNGTFINGKRLTGATSLKNGDMIGLGETVTLGYEIMRGGEGVGEGTPAEPMPRPDAYQPQQQQPQQTPPPADPYQQPRQDPYQPPREQYPQAEDAYPADPYQAPAQQDYAQQQAYSDAYGGAYPQQQQPAYEGYYPQQQGQQGYYQASPPPPGYDYDPYAMREDEGGGMGRVLFFGCLGLMLFCCCITIAGAVIVDTLNLYCDVPVLRDVLEAVGMLTC